MKEEAKKKVFLRHEIRKLYEWGYTEEQMEEAVKKMFADGDITFDDIVEALVKSRWNDITFERRLNDIESVLKWILRS